MKNKKELAKQISRTIYIIVATTFLMSIATGLFFERYRLRNPIIEREMLSPVIDQVEAKTRLAGSKEVSNSDKEGSTEAGRGEGEVSAKEAGVASNGSKWGDYTIEEKIEQIFGDNSEWAKKVAFCESSLIPTKENKESSAKGLFQIMSGLHGIAPKWLLNEDINIMVAKAMYDKQGEKPWLASRNCWRKTLVDIN